MPEIPRLVLAPVEYVPVFSLRLAREAALCLLLTACNVGVIASQVHVSTASLPVTRFEA